MDHIASETMVASQMLANHSFDSGSRISTYYDTTVNELYTQCGIILAMGVVMKTYLEEYCGATPDIFCAAGFSAHMTIDRFLI